MKSPLSQWSLRNRLVLGVALLSALGFIASGVVAQKSLETFLVHQIDDQLLSVANGALPRISQAGIIDDDQDRQARSFSARESGDDDDDDDDDVPPTPLTSVPTATSLTLLNAEGNVIGRLGGGLNRVSASDYLEGISLAETLGYEGAPFTVKSAEENFRVLALPLPANVGSVAIAQSLEDVERTLNRLQWLLLLIGGIVISFIAFASRLVIRVSLKPLSRVEETAEKIAAGDLSARLPDARPSTEVGRLTTSLNTMLSRIEESFLARQTSEDKLRRFVADASHELRTPLTAIRGFAELHRQGAISGESETKELLGRIEGESIRMGSLVEDLLLLARIDQGREMKHLPVEMIATVEDVVASAQVIGPDHPIIVVTEETELYTLGDEHRIHQVIANLLTNARTHTPAGTPITVSISQHSDGVRVSVADKGPGLSREDQDKIFERFYRADSSRVRIDGEGSGLGLSIVDAVMKAHGGSVSVTSSLGEGATFTLFFPQADN
jgi:two-component system OmpR family sensor kinase